MFKQDPLSRSRMICKLTGDAVNKSEEHIWKHLNGKRFLNKLEREELGKLSSNGTPSEQVVERQTSVDGDKRKKKKQNKGKRMEEIISEVRNSSENDSDSEEADFWMPPAGDRWDLDDGGDRWGSVRVSGQDSEEKIAADDVGEVNGKESEELSKQTKRMSIEIGPSSFASRKKKSKKNPTT
uniref:Surfeit locus protein 2 n=1 Tax=Rhizophora mucronata TaxID=61149 RepID=A0A2P2J0Y7_RHIMU